MLRLTGKALNIMILLNEHLNNFFFAELCFRMFPSVYAERCYKKYTSISYQDIHTKNVVEDVIH